MNHRARLARMCACAVLSIPFVAAGAARSALAQGADGLVGTWALVSSVTEKDGTRTDQFGPAPSGMLSLDGAGHFMLTIIGAELPKIASNNRAGGTAQENKAIVSRSVAMLGTYSVKWANKSLTFRVESSTFPNWNGTEPKRSIMTSSKDELTYVTPTASSGGVGTVSWRRVK